MTQTNHVNTFSTGYAAVAAAIADRRTIKQFLPEAVAPENIAKLIDLAVWAPERMNAWSGCCASVISTQRHRCPKVAAPRARPLRAG